jgi:hypothetical protein
VGGAAVAGRSRSMVNVIAQLPTAVCRSAASAATGLAVNGPWVSLGLWNGGYVS